jgi:hypothetical protein
MLLAILLLLGQTCEWDFQSSFSRVDNMHPGSGGTILAAGPGGVFRFDPETGAFGDFYSYPDHLPGLQANDVLEETGGNLWVAPSDGGLAGLVDGEWEVFTVYEGIPGSGTIYCLEEAAGKIWAGTDAGVAMESGEGFVSLDESSTNGGLPTTDVYDMSSDGEYLWLATGKGVYRLDLSASPYIADSWDSPGDTGELGIEYLALGEGEDPAGVGSQGVYVFQDGARWILMLADPEVSRAAWTSWGLLASAEGVLRRIADSTWVEMGSGFPQGVAGSYYAGPLLERQGVLWCGIGPISYPDVSWGLGLGRLEGPDDTWEVVTIPGMPACNINQVVVGDGLTLMGSRYSGLLVEHSQGWRQYGQAEGLPRFLQVYAVAPGQGTDIWCSAYHYGLSWVGGGATYDTSDDSVLTFTVDSIASPPGLDQVIVPLLNNQVRMLRTQGDVLWLAQEAFFLTPEEPSGIVAVTGNPPDPDQMTFTAYQPEAGGMAAKNVRALCPQGNDLLWVVYSEDAGCQLLDHGGTPTDTSDDQWLPAGRPFGTQDGLTSNTATCVACGPDGSVYIGTPLGVCSYAGSGSFDEVAGAGGSITAMEVDGAGRLWANSSQGMILVEDGSATVFDSGNSPYVPTTREAEEDFAALGPDGATVYFSSIHGLWAVSCGGGGQPESGGPMFYPQPWKVEEESLGIAGIPADQPVEVSIYGVGGGYLCSRDAASASEWSWDGMVGGSPLSSGVYVALVRWGGDSTRLVKLAVVR